MKYIKKFEDIDNEFKKYLVWEKPSNRGQFSIFKFGKIKDGMLYFSIFNKRSVVNLNIRYVKKHIIYMSDNLEDCENFIEAKKYNI